MVAAIFQVADIGIRMSLRLYEFGETVAAADRSILTISKDVSLTSSVLKELGHVFEEDSGHVRSDNATKTAEKVMQECSDTFKEMDTLLLAKIPQLNSGVTAGRGKTLQSKTRPTEIKARARLMLERLRWPKIKDKIDMLNGSLDRMKSTLTLLLNVILYAQQISKRFD